MMMELLSEEDLYFGGGKGSLFEYEKLREF